MKLSKTTTYAILALECLHTHAAETGAPMRAREVAESLGIPTDSALKVLQALARGGLLDSTLGRRGGYRPKADARDVSLLAVIELMDGPIAAGVPATANASSAIGVALAQACDDLRDRLRADLGRVTLDRLMDDASAETATELALAG
ncbi:MAG: Rrf2 family transcriptional regulator [Planctomycetota bacterium]